MEPIDYIKHLKLAEENYEFNRGKFFKEFQKEFLEYLENDTLGLDANGKMHFKRFREIVASFLQKYNAISRLRAQMRADKQGLSKAFWGYLYANIIIPKRDEMFPEESQAIKARVAKKAQKRAQKDNPEPNWEEVP